MGRQAPKVFISYSHDTNQHEQRVLALAERLRSDGVEADLDQYVASTPAEGWPRWMLDRLDWADFVLVVCTETYYRRFRSHEEPGKGKGADWEGHLITLVIYHARSRTTKFVPVLFDRRDEQFIPEPLRGHTHYQLDSEDKYAELYAFLTGQASLRPGELGSVKTLARKPVDALRFDGSDMQARQSTLSNIPDQNPFFTGREGIFVQLREALVENGRAALSGLGGVGKTQTAVEYAHRHLKEYNYAFWVTADSRETLASGYVTIAGLAKLPESSVQDQALAVSAVRHWFTSHKGWLLILDNADDLGMMRAFIPAGKNGHVLLTTRVRAVGSMARLVEIQEMGMEEAALLILRRAKHLAEGAPLAAAAEADQTRAKEIAMQLGGLPLALDQAAAYIEETACGLSDYLGLYRNHAPRLLRRRGTLASDHPYPVATTWALSFESIKKSNSAAAELLCFCAFLHPDRIPEEVFSEGAPELGPVLGPVGSDAFARNSAIAEIIKYSLLRRDPNARTFEIHRLVQAVFKQGMDESTQRLWAERVVRAVNRAFPLVEFSSWPACDRILPQAHACAELISQWGFEFPEVARLLNQAGFYLYERGRYTEVEPLFERTLAIREKILGPKHPDMAASLNNLAVLYRAQGRYAKAGPLFDRALAIWEEALGPEHPYVATSLHNLALLYRIQCQYAKAEPFHQRALAIREKVLGPEHPNVAPSLNDLAMLYRAQGQYAKAEPLLKRALAIREKALGPEHPDVAQSLNNLALLYHDQGQHTKAEPLFEQALAIQQTALGPKHPYVARTLNDLAGLYCTRSQYAKAEPLFERALAIREMALGPEHPDVATSLENYAFLLRNMGRPVEAGPLESRGRAIRAKNAEESALHYIAGRIPDCTDMIDLERSFPPRDRNLKSSMQESD